MAETLEFTSSIYTRSSVEETAAAYAELLDCQIDAGDSRITVHLSPKVEGIEDLGDHFANHVLHLSIVESRGTES